ncbi:MAG: GNAT family N-acetyltransferase [Ornithinimicrobium sp.]
MTDSHPDYQWGQLSVETAPKGADLLNLLARVDNTDEFLDVEDLIEDLGSAAFDATQDSWAVWCGQEMVGIGQVFVPEALSNEGLARAHLFGGIHPSYRGRGLGRDLLLRQEQRAVALAQERHPEQPIMLYVDGGVPGAAVRPLLTHRGYDVARYFAHMVRPISAGPVVSRRGLPGGVTLLTPTLSMSERLRQVHNLAFEDHWGSGPRTEQSWRETQESRSQRPQFSTVAVDAAGEPLSYVWAAQWVERELYIEAVGTVPSARHQGLAGACLTRTLDLAASSGEYDQVDLGVDSASPTGATRLYEQLGFHVDRTFALYSRPAADSAIRAGV